MAQGTATTAAAAPTTGVKLVRPGKIAIVLHGKYAGKKAVIVKASEEGTKQRPFSHALIVGIEEAPLRVTEEMTVEKIAKRSRVKPFVKVINFNHLLITRYTVDNLDFKGILSADEAKDPSKKLEAKKALKELFQERYVNGSNKWLFQKLRF